MNAQVRQAVDLRLAIERAGGLAGVADLARRWHVSTERARQLAAADGFPDPVAVVSGRPAYAVDECDQWRRERLEASRTVAA